LLSLNPDLLRETSGKPALSLGQKCGFSEKPLNRNPRSLNALSENSRLEQKASRGWLFHCGSWKRFVIYSP